MDTFLSLVRTQNVSHTAKELNLAQSTVSKRLKQLEVEIGLKLFERAKGSKTFTLTPAGQKFIDIAENWQYVWNEIQVFKKEIPQLTLSIGTLDSLNFCLFPELFRLLAQHIPKIKLKIITVHSPETYDLVERKMIDMGFSLILRDCPNVITEECFIEPMYIIKLNTPANLILGKSIAPNTLNSLDELFVPWGKSYQNWHDQIYSPYDSQKTFLDTTQLIFAFFIKENQWAIVPKSVALKAINCKKYIAYGFKDNPPPNRICYKLTHRYPRYAAKKSLLILDQYLSKTLNDILNKKLV